MFAIDHQPPLQVQCQQRRQAHPPLPVALAERENNLRSIGVQAAPIAALSRPFEDPVPSELALEGVDLATFNYHDLGHLGVDRAAR